MRELLNIPYSKRDSSESHLLDLYLPDADSFPLLVYFHGGGLEKGSKKSVATTRLRGIMIRTLGYL